LGIKSIGFLPFLSVASLFAPLRRSAFTLLVDPSFWTPGTAICRGVNPWTSYASMFGFILRM
jgi:hypothetical protein